MEVTQKLFDLAKLTFSELTTGQWEKGMSGWGGTNADTETRTSWKYACSRYFDLMLLFEWFAIEPVVYLPEQYSHKFILEGNVDNHTVCLNKSDLARTVEVEVDELTNSNQPYLVQLIGHLDRNSIVHNFIKVRIST